MKAEIQAIARMESDFPTKFGIPRQSGLVEELRSTIVFEPEFRNPDALRGIEGYSHLWLIWRFSATVRPGWSPTVRPPRLGGNTRMGVFATRSPFRPNNLGLSCVRLLGVEETTECGTVLHVGGADLMDGTPIFDIKPYIPYSDSHSEALGGFTDHAEDFLLKVDFPEELRDRVSLDKQQALLGVLSHDPRPSYQRDSERIYGLSFAGYDVRFRLLTKRSPLLMLPKFTKTAAFVPNCTDAAVLLCYSVILGEYIAVSCYIEINVKAHRFTDANCIICTRKRTVSK